MDKKKIISSITLAGMLATSVAGSGVFAAETSDPATKALGEYSKLITGKVAVPFILQSETDRVTGKDMKVAYPGKTITVDDDAVLKTGDVVNVNGEPRTIVIYGDVNSDGKINIMDAVAVLNHVKGKTTLTDAQFAAADLNNNGSLNILEATGVLNVAKGKFDYKNIATAPESEVSKVTNKEITSAKSITLKFDLDASKYTYSIRDNKTEKDIAIITVAYNSTKKTATLTTGTDLVSADDQTYTLTIKDKDGNVVSSDTFKYVDLGSINVGESRIEGEAENITADNQNSLEYRVTATSNKIATTVAVTLKDSAGKEVTGTATLPAYSTSVVVNNFSGVSNLIDGQINVSIKITDENGNMVEESSLDASSSLAKVQKDTKALEISDIITTRSNAKVTANIVMKDGVAVDNEYFIVKKASESAPTASEVVAANKTIASDLDKVELTENVEYTIYVVAENANGVKSNIASASIKANVPKLETVLSVSYNMPVAGEFTWVDDNNTDSSKISGYKAILYINDKAIAVKTVNEKSVNFLQEIKNYIQENVEAKNISTTKIKVGVIAIGANSNVSNSVEKCSAEQTSIVTKMATPSITLGVVNAEQKVTLSEIPGATTYKINIYVCDEDGNIAEKPIQSLVHHSTDREFNLTTTLRNLPVGHYKVTAIAQPSAESAFVDSDESDLKTTGAKDIYNIKAPSDFTISLKDATTATGSFGAVLSDDANLTYTVEYAENNGFDKIDWEHAQKTTLSSSAKGNSLYTFTISSLSADKTYSVRISVKYTSISGEIVYTDVKDIKTAKGTIDLGTSGKTVGTDIIYNENGLKVNGVIYKSNTDAPNYEEIANIVKVLKNGDSIKYNDEKILSVTKAVASEVYYGDALRNAELTVNDTNTTAIHGSIGKVIMNTNAKADLSDANVENVTLNGGANVTVKSGTALSVTGSVTGSVTINGIQLTNLIANTKIKATSAGLEIVGGTTDTVKISTDKDATIKFVENQQKNVEVTSTGDNKTITINASERIANLSVKANSVSAGKTGIVDISNLLYNAIDIADKASIKTNTEKTIDGYTITPNGYVTISKDSTKIKINGKATVKFEMAKTESVNDKDKTIIKNGETVIIGTTDTKKLTHIQGEVNYSIKNMVVTVESTTDLTIE